MRAGGYVSERNTAPYAEVIKGALDDPDKVELRPIGQYKEPNRDKDAARVSVLGNKTGDIAFMNARYYAEAMRRVKDLGGTPNLVKQTGKAKPIVILSDQRPVAVIQDIDLDADVVKQVGARVVTGATADTITYAFEVPRPRGFERMPPIDWRTLYGARNLAEVQADMLTLFGEDKLAEFDHYNTLVGEARDTYNDTRPYLAAMSIMTFHGDEYRKLVETFGQDAFAAWALRPASDGSDAANKARGAYYDQHPAAFLINAWIYGRYEAATGSDLAGLAQTSADYYDFGKDYNAAIARFGDSIWSVVAGYRRGWSKAQKSAYIKANPEITAFWDWWYGAADDGDSYRRGYYRSSYRRSYRRYARRAGRFRSYSRSYGSGYSRGGSYTPYVRMPEVYPREMARELEVDYAPRPWEGPRGKDTGPWWLQAGEALWPREAENWKPRRVWKS